RLPPGSDFRRWVWITIAPFVTTEPYPCDNAAIKGWGDWVTYAACIYDPTACIPFI
ncbi:try9 domain protein, partial [Yersinia pestis PY-47]